MKNQIRIGDSDLILLTKHKEEKDWNVTEINKFGDLPPIDYIKSWPVRKIPVIMFPSKGWPQKTKNVYEISRSSEEEVTPKKKKKNKTLGGVYITGLLWEKRFLKGKKFSKS